MRERVITALIAMPIALAATLANTSWPIGILCLVAFAICSLELTRIYTARGGGYAAPSPGFLLCIAAINLSSDPNIVPFGLTLLWGLFLVGLVGIVLLARGERKLPYRMMASFYLFAPLIGCVLLQHASVLPGDGWFRLNLLLLVVVPLWAGDTAGILIGKAFGKHALAPTISENKTWEGAAANFGFCLIVAVALCPILAIPIWKALICGVLSGTLGQIGDLLESSLKRSSGLKDSGSILPGHGGLLDRLDSLLLSALPVATVLLML